MRRLGVAAGVALLAAVGVGAYVVVPRSSAGSAAAFSVPVAGASELAAVKDSRVYFAHQSIGGNILTGVPEVYAEAGQPEATIEDTLIGVNGDPMGKISEFDALVRGGVGDRVDVAVLKLCYEDVTASTDVDAVAQRYLSTLTALRADYPQVSFVAVTVPLTTERDLKRRVKAALGRDQGYGPDDNVARERFNQQLRAAHEASGPIFDLAAVESTAPDGSRVAYSLDGVDYLALYPGYASDNAHLNAEGSKVTASAFLAVLGQQVPGRDA